MNTNVFRNISYGVYVISTLDQNRPTGCIANSIMQITSSPATIALSMNHDNYTNKCMSESGMFTISILSEQSDPSLIGRFGFQSGKDTDKFDGISYDTKEGLPIITDSCGYIVCKIIDKLETSTHTVFLGEVIDGDIISSDPAMTYSYYHKVVKGKSPKNAPTYLPETDADDSNTIFEDKKSANTDVWVCSVCGYVYDGDIPFEELPDDYKCPICKVSKDKFVKRS